MNNSKLNRFLYANKDLITKLVPNRYGDAYPELIRYLIFGDGGILKRWTGTEWVNAKLKVYVNNAWLNKPLKMYDGKNWLTIETK